MGGADVPKAPGKTGTCPDTGLRTPLLSAPVGLQVSLFSQSLSGPCPHAQLQAAVADRGGATPVIFTWYKHTWYFRLWSPGKPPSAPEFSVAGKVPARLCHQPQGASRWAHGSRLAKIAPSGRGSSVSPRMHSAGHWPQTPLPSGPALGSRSCNPFGRPLLVSAPSNSGAWAETGLFSSQ